MFSLVSKAVLFPIKFGNIGSVLQFIVIILRNFEFLPQCLCIKNSDISGHESCLQAIFLPKNIPCLLSFYFLR